MHPVSSGLVAQMGVPRYTRVEGVAQLDFPPEALHRQGWHRHRPPRGSPDTPVATSDDGRATGIPRTGGTLA